MQSLGIGLSVTNDSIIQELFLSCKAQFIQVLQSISETSKEEIKKLKHDDAHWKVQKLAKDKFELGDRIKIVLKKRQLKQKQQEGDLQWDEAITKELDDIGTIVAFLPDGALEPVVHFPNSGRKWAINPEALFNVSATNESDGSNKYCNIDLKIGDHVELAFEQAIVKYLQNAQKTPYENIIRFQEVLGKIISFDGSGYVYVTIGDKFCLLINPALLKSVDRISDPTLNIPPNQGQKMFPLSTKVTVTSDINQMFLNPSNILNPRYYLQTQILGEKGEVTYHGVNGEIGVTIREKTYILPHTMLGKREKERKPKKGGHGVSRPSYVNDLVHLRFAHHQSFERVLQGLRLPLTFAHEVCQKAVKFLGYASHTIGVVLINGVRLNVNTMELVEVPQDLQKQHDMDRKRCDDLKVGDEVQLNVPPSVIMWCLSQGMAVPEFKRKVLFSPSKLVAFDDTRGLAVLKNEKKFYTVDSQFITFPHNLQMDFLKQIEDNKAKLPDLLETLYINDIGQSIKVMQETEISFENPKVLAIAQATMVIFDLNESSNRVDVPKLKAAIHGRIGCEVVQNGPELTFTTNNVEVRIYFSDAQEEKRNILNENIITEMMKTLSTSKIQTQVCTEKTVEDIPQEPNLDPSNDPSTDEEDETVPHKTFPLQSQNPPQTSMNGTVHQTVSFDRSTKEIVVQCKLNPEEQREAPNTEVAAQPFPQFNRQNSEVLDNIARSSQNIINVFSPNHFNVMN